MKLIDIEENKVYTDGKWVFERIEAVIRKAGTLEDLKKIKEGIYYWGVVSSINKLNSDVFEYMPIDCICNDKTITLSKEDIQITMTKKQFEEIYDKCIAPF